MPSASNKLEKQASIGSTQGSGGGNSGGGGGVAKKPQDVINSNAENIATSTSTSTSNSNNISSTTNEGSVTSNSNNTKGAPMSIVLEANNPMKQTITTIDHKIRNLEKRKTKLECYRSIQATGKELSSDQKAAVAKYDAVIATLEFARDLSKQMLQFVKDAEKEQKKQARKEVIARALAETAKIREVLTIQNILNCFTDDAIRDDFISGDNGAIKLETADINILEKFCVDVQTCRPESADDVPFLTAAQKAAELFSMTIDGRPKTYSENITYDQLRRIFNQIQESGYLDKVYQASPEPEIEQKEEEEELSTAAEGEEHTTPEENSLEEGMEKLNVSSAEGEEELEENNMTTRVCEDNDLMPPQSGISSDLQQKQPSQLQQQIAPQQQQQQQQPVKEHLELQQQAQAAIPPQQPPQQISVAAMQPPSTVGVSGPNFQAPPPAGAAPVHVGMFPAQQMQPTPPQLQQVPPGSIIGVPQGPPQMVTVPQAPPPQQRQMMASPATTAGGPLPQGAIPIHATPQPGHFTPTTVRAVEQGLFTPHQRQQFLQQIRPVAELIGNGSFYFLQESELDSPEIPSNGPIGSVVFEQQPPIQHQQQTLQQPTPQHTPPQPQQLPVPQPQQPNLLIHGAELQAADLHKTQQQHHLQQQPILQQQQQPPQQTQPIPTQTFTNQSFPHMQPPSASATVTVSSSAINSNTPTLASTTPSPMFHQQQQKHPQLFSPVSGPGIQPQDAATAHQQQLLLTEQQQQQPPMMIMARLAAPQARLPPHNAPQPTLGMHPGEVRVSDVTAAVGFLGFENSVVTALTYEQQVQQQLAAVAKASAAAAAAAEENKTIEDIGGHNKFNSSETVVVNEWDAMSKANANVHATNIASSAATNAAASAALANALKTGGSGVNLGGGSSSSSSGSGGSVMEPPTKWSTEMNALSNPPTPSSNSDNTPTIVRKIEWTTSNNSAGGSGGGGNSVNNTSGGGYGDGGGTQSSSNTHDSNHWNSNQQQDGVHYNNGRQFQRRRGRGGYGNSSQQNGGGRGGSGIYFRNNDNSSSGSYYQNGGGNVYSNKEGSRYDSGNYRGPRGAGNGRGNAPPRTLGGRNSGGGQSNTSSNTYINRSSQRMPMGLENKN